MSSVVTDSDWGGSSRDRKSTSGGAWMIGKHCIKTWCATQGPYALSSGAAELYAIVEGVTRAKGLRTLAWEIGFRDLVDVVRFMLSLELLLVVVVSVCFCVSFLE